jgi:hypothetical protein
MSNHVEWVDARTTAVRVESAEQVNARLDPEDPMRPGEVALVTDGSILFGDPATIVRALRCALAEAERLAGTTVPASATPPALPRDEYGLVRTDAAYGNTHLVEVTYTTEHDGSEPTEGDTPRTLHGPFFTEDEAKAWIEDRPDFDDVDDYLVIPLNSVRPEPEPEAQPLYLELDRVELVASDDGLKSDLEVTCIKCGHVLCDAEHTDSLGTLARIASEHVCDVEAGA